MGLGGFGWVWVGLGGFGWVWVGLGLAQKCGGGGGEGLCQNKPLAQNPGR